MSWIQTGACPKCGSPIYVPMVWHGIYPPPPRYTCEHGPHRRYTSSTNTEPKSPENDA